MVIDDASSTLTFRQWVKFGRTGSIIKLPENTVDYASVREKIGSSLWTPSQTITGFSIGQTDEASSPWSYYCVNAKMFSRTTEPTLAELDTIARNTSPDTLAWGDWLLDWEYEAPNLSDRSGHGRNLAVAGDLSALYEGDLFDISE